jgi:pimeloyl-ACP methyl ester carboxylesterase
MAADAGGNGLLLVAAPRGAGRPASFWRFPGAPAPGTGRTPVLALAGLGLDGRIFSRLAPLARERDLVLVNLPNDLPPGAAMEDLAREALSALDAAGHAGRPAVWLGSSFGGMAALAGAAAFPGRTAGLVLVGTAPGWGSVPARLRAVSRIHGAVPRALYPRVFAFFMAPPGKYAGSEIRDELRVQMLHRTKGHVASCLAAMRGFDGRPLLAGVRAPSLVLHGERDGLFHRKAAALLAAGLPRARLRTFPDCGHLPHATHPGPFLEALRGFLAEEGL